MKQKRLLLSLGAGWGYVERINEYEPDRVEGAAFPLAIGVEMAGRSTAVQVHARFLPVLSGPGDPGPGRTVYVPSFLMALRGTPGPLIFEAGAGVAYVAYEGRRDAGAGWLLRAALGARGSGRLRMLFPFELAFTGQEGAVAMFVGGVLEMVVASL